MTRAGVLARGAGPRHFTAPWHDGAHGPWTARAALHRGKGGIGKDPARAAARTGASRGAPVRGPVDCPAGWRGEDAARLRAPVLPLPEADGSARAGNPAREEEGFHVVHHDAEALLGDE